ncbi:MAG: LIC_10190 family membrane protein [Phycisphaerae bacterium]
MDERVWALHIAFARRREWSRVEYMLPQVLEMLGAMSLVAAGWAALTVVFVGLGLLVLRLTGATRAAPGRAFWIGLAAAVGVLQMWHLRWPVSPAVPVMLACVSALGFAVGGRGLVTGVRGAVRRHRLLLLVAILAAVWLCNRAIGPCRHTDSGLYHLQVVRWYRSFPTVPGLGNLHYRYASNNANLLLAASVEAGPLSGRSAHVLNSLLIYALLVNGLVGAGRLLSHRRASRVRGAFDATLAVMAVQMSNHWMVSSHSTDVLPAVCCAIAASQMVALLSGGSRRRDRPGRVVLVVALLATAVCGKLTAAPFAVAAAVLLVGWWLKAGRPGGSRTVAIAGAFAAVLPVSWILYGLVLSGWAFYPLPVLAADVDWRIPSDIVSREWDYIAHSGRAFGPLDQRRSWLELAGRWQRDVLVPAAVAVVAAGMLAVVSLRRRKPRTLRLWLLLIPPAVGIAAWLMVSPQRRLGFHLVWIFAASLVAMLSAVAWPRPGRRTITVLLVLWAALAAGNLKKVYTPPVAGGFHAPPSPELREERTACGVSFGVPEDGFCWDAPIPCTPRVHPNLRLRKPGDLSAGFRIERTDNP